VAFSLTELSDSLLSWIIIYGPAMLFLVLLLGALGIPVPATFLLLASGAFVRQGVLDLSGAFTLGLVGAVLGDTLSYGMGRFARRPIVRRFGRSPTWQKAELNLRRRGGVAIYLTRWLLTPIAIPTNLVAGSTGYPLPRFLAYDLAGELTWLFLFGGVGYLFSSQWEAMSQLISDFSGVLVGIVLLGLGLYLVFRRWNHANNMEKYLLPEEAEIN
jgi:membrane protein DedA with SNARE-associated domain